jgi:YlmC/YmxH family sporulation protein
MRFSELKEKEVINTKTGSNLGRVGDLGFDCCTGKVISVIVPGPPRFCCLFGSDSEYVIPYDCIIKIGPDVILVDICEEKFLSNR